MIRVTSTIRYFIGISIYLHVGAIGDIGFRLWLLMFEEIFDFDFKSRGKTADIDKADVSQTTFNTGDIGSIHIGQFSQFFLREAP